MAIRKLPAEQQRDDLFERSVRREIVNIVSTIRQAADAAFDITELG